MSLPRAKKPRIVIVTRKTLLELLLERHGTPGQARFYVTSRGQAYEPLEVQHRRFEAALHTVMAAVPADQRHVRVDREALDRFLFAPDDVVVIVGQDGLVPNAAKYLQGQLAIGVNPDPGTYDGVLCQHPADSVGALLHWLGAPDERFRIQPRVMASAVREDGQRLLALNEVFIGHRTHQSARYTLVASGKEERHSSSGVICATGTGSTGWATSIARQRGITDLPAPEEARLAWFVREPFPSVSTGASLDAGAIRPGEELVLRSEMGDDGVVFADGIETDRLEFLKGHALRVSLADERLNLVVSPPKPAPPAPPDASTTPPER